MFELDKNISFWFHNFDTYNIIHMLSQILSGVGIYIYIYFICFLVILYFTYTKLKNKIFLAGAMLLISSLIVHFVKILTIRERPYILFGRDGNSCPTSFSFPSGHSQMAIFLALILGYIYPKYKFGFIIIAILIGISRMILGCHYFSDVLCGFIIGILGYLITKKYIKTI